MNLKAKLDYQNLFHRGKLITRIGNYETKVNEL